MGVPSTHRNHEWSFSFWSLLWLGDSWLQRLAMYIHIQMHPYTHTSVYIHNIYTYPHMYIYVYIDIRPYSDIRPQTSSTHSTARARCSIFSMPACACLGKFDHDRFFCSPEPWESMGLFKGIVIPKRPNYSGEWIVLTYPDFGFWYANKYNYLYSEWGWLMHQLVAWGPTSHLNSILYHFFPKKVPPQYSWYCLQ